MECFRSCLLFVFNCFDGVKELCFAAQPPPYDVTIGHEKTSVPRALDKGFQGFIILIASNVRISLGIAQASLALRSTLTDIL